MAGAHPPGLKPRSAWDEFGQGTFAILPAAIAVIPFALLLGALAAQKGLSPLEVGLMSSLVFAGSSQMVAVDIWRDPAPWALLGLTTLTINLRHVMMGASLSLHLGGFRPWQRLLGVAFLADEIWALAERRAAMGQLHPAYYAGLAALLYLNFICWSVVGAIVGPAIKDPEAWGFDFAFTAIFLGLIVGFWRGPGTAVVMAASAVAAVITQAQLGGVWHVIAGAIAGMLAATLLSFWREEPKT
ncbi:MAG: branched-chain amino acid ABC transporter permease [Proteobacteria bacterium]|jgi:Predicted branched-chain amino acid permease (azaleucine resistance)|nr:MAG: branched-chain amino acid ABC transporter permease [Pseudomonadota bacterium]